MGTVAPVTISRAVQNNFCDVTNVKEYLLILVALENTQP